MFYMARDNRLELRAQVPEADLRYIKPAQTVVIHSSYTADKDVKGRVREISPLVDNDTRLATVRVDVPGDAGLKPGMYAEGKIDIGGFAALTVPANAIINQDDKHVVFILHNDQVQSSPVSVGSRDSGRVEIESGLNPNDQVVIDGAGFLKDGDIVAVSK